MQDRGIITDAATGRPLEGATVVLIDEDGAPTTNRTTTDSDGSFSIDVPDSDSHLMVSYVGFLSHSIAGHVNGGTIELIPGTWAASVMANKTPVSLDKKISKPVLIAGIAIVIIVSLFAAYSVAHRT